MKIRNRKINKNKLQQFPYFSKTRNICFWWDQWSIRKKETLDKVWKSQTRIIYLHCGYKSMDVATSQKTKDQHRSGWNPVSPRTRTDEINWPAGKAFVRGGDTSKPTPTHESSLIPSFEYPDPEDNSCIWKSVAGNLSRDGTMIRLSVVTAVHDV